MAKKTKVAVISPEEKREQDLRYFIKNDIRFVPEPTYAYNIGDRVSIGNLKDVYVCDIIENGKAYEIDYTSIDSNYGSPITHTHQKMFVTWLQIRPYDETSKESLIRGTDLRLSYSQMSLYSILSKVYYFGTDMNPEYQRDYVWSLDDKVELIDSIFNNVDIGKFVFACREFISIADYGYEIIDGKQRVRAILDYYENRFAYKGKYFNDLCPRDKNFFTEYSVSIAEVRNVTKKEILQYFIKLNKQGRIMDKAQIEKVEQMLEEELKSK